MDDIQTTTTVQSDFGEVNLQVFNGRPMQHEEAETAIDVRENLKDRRYMAQISLLGSPVNKKFFIRKE
jgi:hypothetical protein